MTPLHVPALLISAALLATAAVAVGQGMGTSAAATFTTVEETRAAMRQALRDRQRAQARSQRLERDAETARDAVEKSAAQAAALAARIQQAEAGITAATARAELVERERSALMEQLGQEQQPLVRLTAALQQFSRRPVALAIVRSGTIADVVHTRALLASAVPQVQHRTGGLRSRIARTRTLRAEAAEALQVLHSEESTLTARQKQLASLQAQQAIALRQASGVADREAERVLALAERARDLDRLMIDLDRMGGLRATLAALPGPVMRPVDPSALKPSPDAETDTAEQLAAPASFIMPVTGRLVSGFGVPSATGTSLGISLAPRGRAQVVAPAGGRVAFAGPYRGYGQIVIIEHSGGWTSLVTGLGRVSVEPGAIVTAGAPLGITPSGSTIVTLELRRDGSPVNPLPLIG